MLLAGWTPLCSNHTSVSQNAAEKLSDTKHGLKGELSPILLSKMSLPGIEVLIEKLLPKKNKGD